MTWRVVATRRRLGLFPPVTGVLPERFASRQAAAEFLFGQRWWRRWLLHAVFRVEIVPEET